MMSDKPRSFPYSAESVDHLNGFAEQSPRFVDEAFVQDVMEAFLAEKYSQASTGVSKRSANTERAFNGDDVVSSAAEFNRLPDKKTDVTNDYLDEDETENVVPNVAPEEDQQYRYLVQEALSDMSEDCLSLNIYTPLVR